MHIKRLIGLVAVIALAAAACGQGGESGTDPRCSGRRRVRDAGAARAHVRRVQHAARGLRKDHLGLPGEVEGRARRPAGHLPGVVRRLARRSRRTSINGFEADIVALSLAPDVDVIEEAGLITHDWTADDGRRHGLDVDRRLRRPSRQSRGHRGLRRPHDRRRRGPDARPRLERRRALEHRRGLRRRDARSRRRHRKATRPARRSCSQGIFSNVTVLDKTARDSIKNFEAGNGDVAITYENEILTAQEAGLEDEMVIPPSTVLIENPVAVVDENADKHCVREVAEAFVEFLHTDEAKELYTTVGFLRPTDPEGGPEGRRRAVPPGRGPLHRRGLRRLGRAQREAVRRGRRLHRRRSRRRRASERPMSCSGAPPLLARLWQRVRAGISPGRLGSAWRSRRSIWAQSSCCRWRRSSATASPTGSRRFAAALASPGAMDAIEAHAIDGRTDGSVINAVFGTLLAYVLVRYEFPGRALLSAMVDLPFAIPTLVTGVMLVALYGPSSPVGQLARRPASRSPSPRSGSCWRCCS